MPTSYGFLDEPLATSIYRGFLLQPNPQVDLTEVFAIEYQFRSSFDNDQFTEVWEDLGTAKKATRFTLIHADLYEDIFYQYRFRIQFTDSSYSQWSDFGLPGNGDVPPGVDDRIESIDELADDLGVFESGILRGVIFETNKNYPKMRMDQNGLWGIGMNGSGSTPLAFDRVTGSLNISGMITGSTIIGSTIYTSANAPYIQMDSGGITSRAANGFLEVGLYPAAGLWFFDSTNSGATTFTLNPLTGINFLNPIGAAGRVISWRDSASNLITGFFGGYPDPSSGGTTRNLARIQAVGTTASGREGASSAIMAVNSVNAQALVYSNVDAPSAGGAAYSRAQAGSNVVTLIDGSNNSTFVKNASAHGYIDLVGPLSVSFLVSGLGAGASYTFNYNIGVYLGSEWVPLGAIYYAAAGAPAFSDAITYSYSVVNSTTIQCQYHNYGAGTAFFAHNIVLVRYMN